VKAISAKQSLALDQNAIDRLGIPVTALMEAAGKSIADFIYSEYLTCNDLVVLVNKGNNGGDAMVAARHLIGRGKNITIFSLSPIAEYKAEPKLQAEILKRMGISIQIISSDKELMKLAEQLSKSDLVVDGLFGVGLSGKLTGRSAKTINLVNSYAETLNIVSVDVPSGINATTGDVMGTAIIADATITMNQPKTGLFIGAGAKHSGKVVIADIGIPSDKVSLISKVKTNIETQALGDLAKLRKLLPKRGADTNKVSFGKVLIVAGSAKYAGAAILSARSALRSGAGLVYLAVPNSIKNSVNLALPEAIVIGQAETAEGSLSLSAQNSILEIAKGCGSLLIGPGLSDNSETLELVPTLIKSLSKIKNPPTIVVDADGLNALVKKPLRSLFNSLDVILTPHPGEMARLSGLSTKEIQAKRLTVAKRFSKKNKITLVLKGSKTIIASKNDEITVNLTGNPVLATAGTGDVLAGLLAGLLAQGLASFPASLAAVYFHGLTADLVQKLYGKRGIIATDIVDALPSVLQ
jgi:NAD(P)H-hydrate epimerase